MAVFTSIPSLSSYDLQAKSRSHQPPSQEINDLKLTADLVLFAWAGVLESLAETPEVVFWFDEQPIRVDTAARTWHALNEEHLARNNILGTAVFPSKTSSRYRGGNARAHREKHEKWLLQLTYTGVVGKWRLSSAFGISKHAMEDVCARLRLEARMLQNDGEHRHINIRSKESSLPLSVLNPTPQQSGKARFLHKVVDFSSHAEKTAIEYLGPDGRIRKVSFAELDALSTRLAFSILAAYPNGEKKQVGIVPILLPQSPELYIIQLAILKAGGAFCPLNLDAPDERIDLIVEDTAARILITTRAMKAQASHAARRTQVLFVDDVRTGATYTQDTLPDLDHNEGLAYVMYTSGSTGTPKGVPISHRASTQALGAHDEQIPKFKRFLQFAAPTFDVSVFETFFPLMRGSTLVCCARDAMLSDLSGTITRLNIDAVELTPTVAGTLLKKRDSAPSLKLLLTIGEMLTKPIVKEFGFHNDDEGILYGMYGPTEVRLKTRLPLPHPNSRSDSCWTMVTNINRLPFTVPSYRDLIVI